MDVTRRIGHQDARIVEELYQGLRRFAAVVAPWELDPDDVLHATLLNVMRSRRLVELDDPAAYIRRAIVNQVKSRFRRARTQRLVLEKLAFDPSHNERGYPSDLSDLLGLAPVERAVLYLHDIEGFSFDEVASMVGANGGSVRMTATRARRKLRRLLAEEVG